MSDEKQAAATATQWAMQQIAKSFNTDAQWIEHWTPHFFGALVGEYDRPRYEAVTIRAGVEKLLQTYAYPSPPKPADVTKAIVELFKERAERFHPESRPTGRARPRQPQPEPEIPEAVKQHREANKARVKELMRRTFANMDTIREAAIKHGYGSPEATRIADRLRDETKDWIDCEKVAMKAEQEDLEA